MARIENIQEIFEKKSDIDLRIKELKKEQDSLERQIRRWQWEENNKQQGILPLGGI